MEPRLNVQGLAVVETPERRAASRCIMANVQQTSKVGAQCDKLATELS